MDRTSKYNRYAKILEQVETNSLYKGEPIDGNVELEKQRIEDIKKLKEIISDELKKDGIKRIMIRGRTLSVIE